ncbi:MAG: 50S ribosomal protein L22 [Chlamydiia bacterium]|nr:50S ribosomal protein L22 [Chlamydiia bacterium]
MKTVAEATNKRVRMSARKARLSADMIRGSSVQEAINILSYSPLRAARAVLKTLKSATANAENNKGFNSSKLVVGTVYVNEDRTMKRAKPKNKGGRVPIMKRSCQIYIGLEEV